MSVIQRAAGNAALPHLLIALVAAPAAGCLPLSWPGPDAVIDTGGYLDSDPADLDSDSSDEAVDDADRDGVPTSEDCDDDDPVQPAYDADCDGVLTTVDCDDDDPSSNGRENDMDCDGVPRTVDCDDADPTAPANDSDCDGVVNASDCDDADVLLPAFDADCDGFFTAIDCDDANPAATTTEEDADCDGAATDADCDDLDDALGSIASDADCDGVRKTVDCDDLDADLPAFDEDCDGVSPVFDCDDTDRLLGDSFEDEDCDGVLTTAWGDVRAIPAGLFTMGCLAGRENTGACDEDESPAHEVKITRPMWVFESEFLHSAWTALGYIDPVTARDGAYPLVGINWWEAVLLANALSAADSLEACYVVDGCDATEMGEGRVCTSVAVNTISGDPTDCVGWRLPTEAEREYAARADSADVFATGSSSAPAWTLEDDLTAAAEVCTAPVNDFGLCDMTGNLYEWVWDWYGPYADDRAYDPTGPSSGTSRCVRGGSFAAEARQNRSAFRWLEAPDSRYTDLGVRLVRTMHDTSF